MRKLLLTLLSVICVACIAFAFGCTNKIAEPNYFKVEYNENQAGVTFVFDDVIYDEGGNPEPFESGAFVRGGLELKFELVIDEDIYKPESLEVTANSQVLTKDENGKYSITVNEDIVILVLSTNKEKVVTLCKGSKQSVNDVPDDRITYLDRDGNEYETEVVTDADQITFKVKISSYYRLQEGYDDITVTASTRIITPDEDGFYTVDLDGDTVVEVQGYEQDASFAERVDGGSGTKNDPFILQSPIDLYTMAGIINSDFYMGRWSSAYYELANDIDLDGEQLFIIGDAVTQYAYFSGSFDGKGHTISNFYIEDIVIDQEEFIAIELSQVGMFGWVRYDGVNVPVIKNLNLKDFSIDVSKSGNYSFYVGSVAGYVDGGNIINCSASGNVTVSTVGGNYVGYAGGIAGVASSVFEQDVTNVEMAIVGCTSDVNLQCLSGNIYAAGGIVGFLNAMAEKAPAYITDCANTANVTGAFRTGGIVGHLSPYASVNSCLSTADFIDARCDLQGATSAEMRYAYAGGIVGYAEYESLVYGCYSASDVSATSVNGASYGRTGYIVGTGASASSSYVESHDALVLNSYSKFGSSATNFTENLLTNTLKWNTENWKWANGADYPAVNVTVSGSSVTVSEFTVNVNFVGNQTVNDKSRLTYSVAEYSSMAKLYVNGEMYEYLSADNKDMRTFGYFFDEALTERVMCSYMPTSDITIYAGFANYGEIAGKYYLRLDEAGSGAYFLLGADGTLLYREGAIHFESTYVYDGDSILLLYNPAFTVVDQTTYSSRMYCGTGKIENGVLSVYDNQNYTQSVPLNAKAEIEGFAYGTYYTDSFEYIFNGDGTVIKNGTVFDFTVSGNTLTIKTSATASETVVLDGGVPVSVDNVRLSVVDIYAGVWETGMLGTTLYNFDGKGSYSYETFNYTNGRKTSVESGRGSYELVDGTLVLDNGAEVAANENGFIEIDGLEYYRQSSFVGLWRFFARNGADVIELSLFGIGLDGYGVAEVKFGTSHDVYTLNYQSGITEATSGSDAVEYLEIYYLSGLIGSLDFSAADLTLNGIFNGDDGYKFCLYDQFSGEWVSDEFGLISINGLGLYNRLTGSNITVVQGTVRANGNVAGSYLLENGTATGTMTFNGKTYNIAYNAIDDSITVTDDDVSFKLTHIDSWVDVTLVDTDGKTYTFDGMGNLTSGGNILVNGLETYKYFNNIDGTLTIKLGNDEGTFAASDNAYVLSVGNTRKELTLYNVYTGEWQVSGMLDGKLVIGRIGIDNIAQGSYLGKDVEFTYLDGILSFDYEGKTLYVISYSTFGRYKFAISEYETTAYGVLNYCVAVGDLDEFAGVYSAKDGGSMMLDGFSNGTLGSGSAIMYNAQGEQTAVYSYKIINRVYQGVEITFNDGTKRLLVESSDGEYTLGNKSYNLITPDILYPGTYYTSYAVMLSTDDEVIAYYVFDGMGTLMELLEGDVYTYTITGENENRREIYIDLTGQDGKKYSAVLDYSQSTETPELIIQDAD